VRLGTRNAGQALGPLPFSFSARQALALSGRPRLVAVRMGKRARLAGNNTTEQSHEKRTTQANRSFQTRHSSISIHANLLL
jgi:hypothetical protein